LKITKTQYIHFAENINYWSLLLFIFSIPLNDRILSYTGLLWIISCLLQGNYFEKLRTFNHKYLYFALSAYFILTCIWFFIVDDKSNALFHIESKLSLVLFPVMFSFSGNKIKQYPDRILFAFMLGNIVASVFCYMHTFATNLFIENGTWHLKLSFFHKYQNLSFWELVNMRTSTFSYVYLSELKHPSYFAMNIVFSLCMAIYLYKKQYHKKLIEKVLLSIYFVYFAFFIYLLQSRSGLISIVLITVIILLNEIIRHKKRKYFLLVILTGFLGIALISSSKKIRNNINQIAQIYKHPSKTDIEGDNDRFQMWYSAWPIIKNNILFGVGPSEVAKRLTEEYKIFRFKTAERFKLNAHNQYIESLLGLGIIGLILLLFILYYCLHMGIIQKNYLLTLLIILLMFSFIFESMLNRMSGIAFMMAFIGIFLFSNNKFSNNHEE
jgi:O-antigen ligase